MLCMELEELYYVKKKCFYYSDNRKYYKHISSLPQVLNGMEQHASREANSSWAGKIPHIL